MVNLETRIPKLPPRPATVDHSFSPIDLEECTDSAPATRSEQAFFTKLKPAPQYEQMNGALVFGQGADHLLPRLKVCAVYGLNSVWSIPWGVWQLEKDVEKWKEEGKSVRPITFLPVDGGNHFVSDLILIP